MQAMDLNVTRRRLAAAGEQAFEPECILHAQAERADRVVPVTVDGDRVIVLHARAVRFGHADHRRRRLTFDPEPIGGDCPEAVGASHERDVEFRDEAAGLPGGGGSTADDGAVAEQDHGGNAAATVVGAYLQMRQAACLAGGRRLNEAGRWWWRNAVLDRRDRLAFEFTLGDENAAEQTRLPVTGEPFDG